MLVRCKRKSNWHSAAKNFLKGETQEKSFVKGQNNIEKDRVFSKTLIVVNRGKQKLSANESRMAVVSGFVKPKWFLFFRRALSFGDVSRVNN